jgi:hypothetical protein
LLVIECVCSDQAVHRSRIEGRVRGIPGWHEVGWDHVERMRAETSSPSIERGRALSNAYSAGRRDQVW